MTKSVLPAEGLWFAVPLRDSGFCVGIVARCNPKGVLLGYFFGPRHPAPPELDDLSGLSHDAALLVRRFGYLGLKQGEWPAIGRAADWDRRQWPTPVFIRYEELTGRSFRVNYDDTDPNKLVGEKEVPPGDAEQGPKDGLLGVGAVEIAMTNLLAANP